MPVQPSYPGVYIEELPSGTRTITGVATSVTAFVGRCKRGAVDAPIRCFGFADFERKCGGLWASSELGYAVRQFFQNGGAEALISRVTNGALTSTVTLGPSAALVLDAASPGAWGENLRATVSYGIAGAVDEAASGTFHLTLEEIDPDPADPSQAVVTRETFRHVSANTSDPRYIGRILEQESTLARLSSASAVPAEVSDSAFAGGSDGNDGGTSHYKTAIDLLEKADIVNLLVIPPPSRTTDTPLDVWTKGASFCKEQRAMLLVDPPSSWSDYEKAASLGDLTSLRTANTAFFYPRVQASDALQEGRARSFAPSGAVAGVIARTDAERGVWKAPAGLDASLLGILDLDDTFGEGELGVLNSRGVNALMARPNAGPVIWGARTGRGADVLASEWKYLPVRRLALFIQESLYRGTRWAVFEPNDEQLWAQLRQAIGTFMQLLYRQGAFQGSSPREAYFVKCDKETTTTTDIQSGVVNVVVGFAPVKPAEFVVLQFQQLAGQ